MNKRVFIAWRGGSAERGAWSPVARLDYAESEYRFVYTQGAKLLPGFHAFPGMGDLQAVYRSSELFPFLVNRLLSRSRPEYQAWLTWGGFDPNTTPDPLAILGVTEGIRQTDSLEVFPQPLKTADGDYVARFFLHGLRHVSEQALQQLAALKAGDKLSIELENENTQDPHAVAVLYHGTERIRLGYVPRYLAREVRTLEKRNGMAAIDLRVARVNVKAPLQMRLLCTLCTPWPVGFAPCEGEAFQPLVQPVPSPRVAHA